MPSSLLACICPWGQRRVDSGDVGQSSMFLAATWTDRRSLISPPRLTADFESPSHNAKASMDVLRTPASVSTCASESHLDLSSQLSSCMSAETPQSENAKESMDVLGTPASVSTCASESRLDLSSQLSSCMSAETPQSPRSESPLPSLCESEIADLDLDAPPPIPATAGTSEVRMQLKGIRDLPEALEEPKDQDADAKFDPEEIALGPDFHFRKYCQRSIRWLPAVKVQWQERHRQWCIVAASSLDGTSDVAELNALETDLRPCVDDEPDIRRIVGTVVKQGTVVQCRVVSGQLMCEVSGDLRGAKVMPHNSSNGRLLVPLDEVLTDMRLLHLRRRNIKLEAYQRQICSSMMAAQRRKHLGIDA